MRKEEIAAAKAKSSRTQKRNEEIKLMFHHKESKDSKKSSAERLKEMVEVLKRHEINRGLSPEKVKLILEDMGPTYIKMGQLMSMRSDVLPESYCEVLAQLRAEVTPMPFEEIVGVIEEEYGSTIDEIFTEIDPKCIGSASIAQVYGATLKNGTKVVLKVQRPGIYQTMERDIRLMKRALEILKIFKNPEDMPDFKIFIDEMWVVAQQEMNFTIEADYIREFTDLNSDIDYVAFPIVNRDLTTSRVLVMEYIDGVQIDDLDELKKRGCDINDIGIKLVENYVKQVVDDGLFHADPHPGNIWVRDGKIIWLDLGMVGRLSNRDRMLLKRAMIAVVQKDIEELKTVILTMGVIKGTINHSKLYEDIERILARYGDLDLESLQLGEMFTVLMDITKEHRIAIPRGISMLGRGILTLEGVLAECSPQVNFVSIMANHISGNIWSDFDLQKELKSSASALHGFAKKNLILPAQISDILKMMMRGQFKFNLEVSNAEETVSQLKSMVDKLVIGILCSSLGIGSGIISTTNMSPKLLGIPLIGFIGYVGSFLLGSWLIISTLKRK